MTLRGFQDSSDERVRAEVARLNRDLTRHYRTAREEIVGELERLHARVLDGVEPEDYYVRVIQARRLQALQAQVERAYTRAHAAAAATITDGSRLAFANTYYQNTYALVGPSAVQGVSLGFFQLPEELVNLAVTGSTEAWRDINRALSVRFGDLSAYRPPYGTLSSMLAGRRSADLRRVQDTLVQMLIQGKGPRAAARALDRALAIGRNNAERILRTESHRTALLGQFAATEHARAEGVEVRRMVVAVLDDRTRPQSAAVDGELENDEGYFVYPGGVLVRVPGSSGVARWDINDRESTRDIVAGTEPTARRMRIPGDRPPPEERDRLRQQGLPIPGETYIIEWSKFDRWARANGLTRNRYGQLVVGQ